ncbi:MULTISPECIES: PadR family transcriptional regulator [unclassified Caloramator]|uniref:PadR family transcriptional regulator n=1 Tax=unclassified Caloramator TaxID=2629145 RepID=UPI00237D4B18|nr:MULTISPECIES: PadR family transcriptional regulator [unclassified Caloramator]MDO6355451.1 PadR family transcriptional regulator [Caloramator sp. CAR-1]WDU84011.1 PadR family transcriptional regulator [Caloramator sp. Dgby_cultured_2]
MKDGSVRNRQLISKVNITSLVKLFILHFLKEREHYGNEIIDRIEICLNYSWRPSPGLIYPLLRSMEENLLIEGWWEEPDKKTKRIYRITDDGLRHYEKIKALYKPLLDESLNIINNTLKEIYKN